MQLLAPLNGEDSVSVMKCEVLRVVKVLTQHCWERATSAVPIITSARFPIRPDGWDHAGRCVRARRCWPLYYFPCRGPGAFLQVTRVTLKATREHGGPDWGDGVIYTFPTRGDGLEWGAAVTPWRGSWEGRQSLFALTRLTSRPRRRVAGGRLAELCVCLSLSEIWHVRLTSGFPWDS